MADAHHSPDFHVRLQDGTLLTMRRDADDRLVATAFVPQGSKWAADHVPAGAVLAGFGPWPSWDANRRNGTLTSADEESGLYEPERLFVLREQYLFVSAEGAAPPPRSLGPIDKAWWHGTEHVVQARQRSAKH